MSIHRITSDAQLQSLFKQTGDGLLVIDFSATWCGPCRRVHPIFENLSRLYPHVTFAEIDIDEMRGSVFVVGVNSVPTFQFFQNSQKVAQVVGANMQEVQNQIDQLGGSKSQQSFSGTGYRLGGGDGSSTQMSALSPTEHPSPTTTQQTDQFDNINQLFLGNLLEMGFTENHSQQALLNTGSTSIQAAIEWIMANPEEQQEEATASKADAGTLMETDESPSSSLAGDGGKEEEKEESSKMEVEEASETASGETTKETSENATPPPRPMTAEEKAEAKQRLMAKIKQKRLEREEQERKDNIEREKNRRKTGRDLGEAKEKWKQAQALRKVEAQKKEKLEAKRAREEIRRKIAAQKKERLEQKSKPQQTTPTATATTPTSSATTPKAAKVYSECLLQIRLLDGQVTKATFKPTDTLSTVHNHVQMLVGQGVAFTLMTSFPRKEFKSSADLQTTLEQADLCPRGTVICKRG